MGVLLPLPGFLHIEMDHCRACRRWSLKTNQLCWTSVLSRAINYVIPLSTFLKRPQSILLKSRVLFHLFGTDGPSTISWSLQPVLLLAFTSSGLCGHKVQHSIYLCWLLSLLCQEVTFSVLQEPLLDCLSTADSPRHF